MKYSRSFQLAGALLCGLAAAVLFPAGAAADTRGLRCQNLTFEVNLSPADATDYQVFGVLCSRGNLKNQTIQIALPGSTYGHLYWDWPYKPEIYSYVRDATKAGYAVLSLDRIGIGRSDHPPSGEVNIASNAYVVHQIVQEIRSGELVVPPFGRVRGQRVALVGHSLGSLIAIQEAATYGDVDGVVLTGISHTVTPALGDVTFQAANTDPRFAGRDIPDGYLTTTPGARSLFYQAPFYDPAVLALDERTKETVTMGELETAFPALGLSSEIRVPVLVVVGNRDGAFCNPPSCTASGSIDVETDFYAPEACAEAVAIPGSGHDLNLHFQAPRTYATVLNWLNRRVGRNPRAPAPVPCEP